MSCKAKNCLERRKNDKENCEKHCEWWEYEKKVHFRGESDV